MKAWVNDEAKNNNWTVTLLEYQEAVRLELSGKEEGGGV